MLSSKRGASRALRDSGTVNDPPPSDKLVSVSMSSTLLLSRDGGDILEERFKLFRLYKIAEGTYRV